MNTPKPDELQKIIDSFYMIMVARGLATKEFDQVCSWHITNGSNIHEP